MLTAFPVTPSAVIMLLIGDSNYTIQLAPPWFLHQTIPLPASSLAGNDDIVVSTLKILRFHGFGVFVPMRWRGLHVDSVKRSD